MFAVEFSKLEQNYILSAQFVLETSSLLLGVHFYLIKVMSDDNRLKFNENFKKFEPSQARCYRRPDAPAEQEYIMEGNAKTSEVIVVMSDSESTSPMDAAKVSNDKNRSSSNNGHDLETDSKRLAIDRSEGKREDQREQKKETSNDSKREKKDNNESKNSDRRGDLSSRKDYTTADTKRDDGKKSSNTNSNKDECKESSKSDVKKDGQRGSSKSNSRRDERRQSSDKSGNRRRSSSRGRRRSASGGRRRSSSRGRRRSASGSRRRSSSKGRRRSTSGSRRRSSSRGRRRSESRGRERTDSRKPRVLDHRTRSPLQGKNWQQNNDSRRRSSSRDKGLLRSKRSSSRPRIIDQRRRSLSQERRKSRSPRRSTSKRRSGSRSRLRRDRSPRGRDRYNTTSETSDPRESGRPRIIDMRRYPKDDGPLRKRSLSRDRRRSLSPRQISSRRRESRSRSRHGKSSRSPDNYLRTARPSESGRSVATDQQWYERGESTRLKERGFRDGNTRHRSRPREEEDLRHRIEMLKRDINRQKMQLEFQQVTGMEQSEESYTKLKESEARWQQLALEEENRSSGRLQHLNDQYRDSSLQPPADHELQQSPPNWRYCEQRRNSMSRSRSRSPRRLYSPFQDCNTSLSPVAPQTLSLQRLSRSRSPIASDSPTYYGIADASYMNRPLSSSRELPAVPQQFYSAQLASSHPGMSPSIRQSADVQQAQRDARAAMIDRLPSGSSKITSGDNKKLNLHSPVQPEFFHEGRRSLSRASSCDRRFVFFLRGSSFSAGLWLIMYLMHMMDAQS